MIDFWNFILFYLRLLIIVSMMCGGLELVVLYSKDIVRKYWVKVIKNIFWVFSFFLKRLWYFMWMLCDILSKNRIVIGVSDVCVSDVIVIVKFC